MPQENQNKGNSYALWEQLSGVNLYTKGYDDFVNQFASEESVNLLYSKLHEMRLYTRTPQQFMNQFFPDVELAKKKEILEGIGGTESLYMSPQYVEEVLTPEEEEEYAPERVKARTPRETAQISPVEEYKDLSIGQKRQALRSDYKKKGIDIETLGESDIYPEDIGMSDFYKSNEKRNAYVQSRSLDLQEKFIEEAKALADQSETQEEFDDKVEKLWGQYEKEFDALQDVGFGMGMKMWKDPETGDIKGEGVEDMIKSFEYLAEEDANTIRAEIKSIKQSGKSTKEKISDYRNLANYMVDIIGVSKEDEKRLRGEINALIDRETLFSGSRISPLGAKQQLEIIAPDIEKDKQDVLDRWVKLEREKKLSKEERQEKDELSRQLRMYSQAERLANKMRDLPDDEGSFWEGLAAPWKDGTVQSLGITDVIDAAMQLQASNKVGNLEDTAADRAVLNILGLYQQQQIEPCLIFLGYTR